MEEPGMGFGIGCRHGLLILFFGLFLGTLLSAQDEKLEVLVQQPSGEISVGIPFSIRFLIDHPVPADIAFIPPELPAGLLQDSIKTELRLVRSPAGRDERWTVIDYTLRGDTAATYRLYPFRISIPGKSFTSGTMQLHVQDPQSQTRAAVPRLYWNGVPAEAVNFEPFTVELRITELPLNRTIADLRGQLELDVPEDMLVERLPGQEDNPSVLAVFSIIALDLEQLSLPRASLVLGTERIHTVPVTIPVADGGPVPLTGRNAAVTAENLLLRSEQDLTASSGLDKGIPVFPEESEAVFLPPFLNRQYALVLDQARIFWDAQDYPSAIAVLRAAERDLEAGYAVSPLRRQAEFALGITESDKELWIPVRLFLILILVLTVLFLFFFISVLRRRYSWFFLVPVFIFTGYIVYGNRIKGRTVIVRSCTAYRIPDTEGGRSAQFSDGSRVVLRNSSGAWAFVEASDGSAGWISGDRLIHY